MQLIQQPGPRRFLLLAEGQTIRVNSSARLRVAKRQKCTISDCICDSERLQHLHLKHTVIQDELKSHYNQIQAEQQTPELIRL